MTAIPSVPCPRCGANASGNFCAACGAPLARAHCTACGHALEPGARFCHKCGAAAAATGLAARDAGAGAPSVVGADRTPWLIAGILVFAIVAGVLYVATREGAPEVPVMANAGNAGSAPGAAAACVPSGPAPDISALTPKQRFDRLADRVTQFIAQSDTACVITFTPMALGAYAGLAPADRDVDARYRTAMLQAQVGMFDNARALADTIMATSPDNLLAYYIRATVAEFAGDSTAAAAARAAFRSHFDAEMRKQRPEYIAHRAFLDQYRTGEGAR